MSALGFSKTNGWIHRSRLERMQFPAGEEHFRAPGGEPMSETPSYIWIDGTDANDYVAAAMWINYMRRPNAPITALVPYLPGARADRGKPLGAAIYTDLISLMRADRVVCFDPHSPTMPWALGARGVNLRIVHVSDIIAAALGRRVDQYVGIIAPDAGAVERAGDVAATLGLPLYRATKKRDFATGKLSGFECEPLPAKGKLLVVDDICDGGGTFMGLAEATGLPKERLDLWVSHGVFSGNAPKLTEHFGAIYTTDSLPGATNPEVGAYITPLTPHLLKERA